MPRPRPYQTNLKLSAKSSGYRNWCGGGKTATEPPSLSAMIVRCRAATGVAVSWNVADTRRNSSLVSSQAIVFQSGSALVSPAS